VRATAIARVCDVRGLAQQTTTCALCTIARSRKAGASAPITSSLSHATRKRAHQHSIAHYAFDCLKGVHGHGRNQAPALAHILLSSQKNPRRFASVGKVESPNSCAFCNSRAIFERISVPACTWYLLVSVYLLAELYKALIGWLNKQADVVPDLSPGPDTEKRR
jgi:hypothetical protein